MGSKSDRRNPSRTVANSGISGRKTYDPDQMMEVLVMPAGTEVGEI